MEAEIEDETELFLWQFRFIPDVALPNRPSETGQDCSRPPESGERET